MKKFFLAFGIAALVIALGFTTCQDANNTPAGDETYIISFDANGGSGGQTADVTATYGKPMPTLTATAPTKAEYFFNGYWDAASGGTMYYTASLVSAKNWDQKKDATLYAQWSQIPLTTITFDANGGGNGSMQAQQIPENTSADLTANTFTRIGYRFEGWATSSDGTVTYTDGQSYTAGEGTQTVTLYAVWGATPPPEVSSNYSVVSLVQSTTVTQAADFANNYNEVLALVRQAIELAGGLDGIVKAGDTVVLKPNIVATYFNWNQGQGSIPARFNGVAPDFLTVRAVAEIVREIVGPYNATTGAGKITVIEGSGSSTTTQNFTNLQYTLANIPQANEIFALENDGTWVSAGNGSSSTSTHTQLTLAGFAYSTASGAWGDYYKNDGKYWVNNRMLNADVFINIPVVKTHWDACITGSIKNIGIGATPARIYGRASNDIGRNNMVNHADNTAFHNWIADYFSCLPCDFVVMDGLQGLGHGPFPYNSFEHGGVSNATQLAQYQHNLRSILASRDSLAIDIVEANILGWDYTQVPYMATLTTKGEVFARGEMNKPSPRKIPLRGDPKDIVVLGNKVDDVRGDYEGNMAPGMSGRKIPTADKTPPTVTINSAAFSGSNLNLNLALSSGANNAVVKVDVYIDGEYKQSFNTNMTTISFDASSLDSGSHNIEVRAFTRYMYSATAARTATK